MRSPSRPQKTNEEKALENRQRIALDKEIEDEEEKLKALARGTLGNASLLSGAPSTVSKAAGVAARSMGGSGGSLLSGGGGSGGSTTGAAKAPRSLINMRN